MRAERPLLLFSQFAFAFSVVMAITLATREEKSIPIVTRMPTLATFRLYIADVMNTYGSNTKIWVSC